MTTTEEQQFFNLISAGDKMLAELDASKAEEFDVTPGDYPAGEGVREWVDLRNKVLNGIIDEPAQPQAVRIEAYLSTPGYLKIPEGTIRAVRQTHNRNDAYELEVIVEYVQGAPLVQHELVELWPGDKVPDNAVFLTEYCINFGDIMRERRTLIYMVKQ